MVGEAMACGLPVVCLRLGGPGLLVDETCGRTIAAIRPEQAVEDLAAAMLELAEDAPLCRRLGAAASHRAKATMSWDLCARRLLAICGEVGTE